MRKKEGRIKAGGQKYHWPILGHQPIKEYLISTLEKDALGHAYLFWGQSYVGKQTVAMHFVGSLFCVAKTERPCWSCPVCKQIRQQTHPDVYEIYPAPDKKNISIDQIRSLQHKLCLRSFLRSYKVAIIENAETLTEEASNALLKTLEEPSEKTILILIANTEETLPATIRSRCQRIFFNVTPVYQLENWLISRGMEKLHARSIARFSNGKPGIAIRVSQNASLLDEQKRNLEYLSAIFQEKKVLSLKHIGEFIKSAGDNDIYATQQLFDGWTTLLRDAILMTINSQLTTNYTLHQSLKKIADTYSIQKISGLLHQIQLHKGYLDRFIKPQLVLENLALTL